MDIKATIDTDLFGYRNRLLLIALGAMLYAAWCLYDARIGYPNKIEAREAFDAVKEEYPEDWKKEWPKVAEANDWDPDREPDELSKGDITTQWLQFAIVFPIGSYCLFSVALWSRRYIGVDDTTLYSHGGVQVPFDQITRIDANRWETKGIAHVYYDIGSGERSILVDDFKYDREACGKVFARLRASVAEDKIEGLSEDEDEPVAEPEATA